MANADDIAARLEELRAVIRAEHISYGELADLQDLAKYIDPWDNELLEWAGVPEEEAMARQQVMTLDDADLDKELSFAEGFGDDIDPNAPVWHAALVAEKARRSIQA